MHVVRQSLEVPGDEILMHLLALEKNANGDGRTLG